MLATNLRRGGGLRDSAVVTVGYDSIPDFYGYGPAGSSITPDANFAPKPGSTIVHLGYFNSAQLVSFYLNNAETSNGGWTKMDVAGTIFLRSAATYTIDTTYTKWTWNTASNPFGTTIGATRNIKWY